MSHSRIVLVRHTQPQLAPGLCYGRQDLALAASYPEELAQLRALKADLALLDPLRIYSSPLARCRRLAEDLAGTAHVCVSESLIELNFGRWEGCLWSEIPRHESEIWTSDFVYAAPPGGESFLQLAQRAFAFLAALPREQNAMLVTHSGVIRALRAWDQGMALERAFDSGLAFGAMYELKRHEEGAAAFAIPPERWGLA